MSETEPQILTLTVTGSQAAQLGARSRKMFVGKDGSIGRSEECDWVLAATGVSRVHAMIRFVNGIYFIEDRSTNGMLLNGSPLLKGDPAALADGDRVRIDNFDISVRLQQDSETIVQVAPRTPAPEAAALPEPEASVSFGPPPSPPPPPPLPAAAGDDLLDFGLGGSSSRDQSGGNSDSLIPGAPTQAGGSLDPLSFLDAPSAPAPEPISSAPPAQGWNHSAGMEDHFRPPTTNVQRESSMLPDDWDVEPGAASSPAPETPIPAAEPPAPPPAPEEPAPVVAPPAAATTNAPSPEADAILRIVVDGVMDVLRARAEIKNTFRLPVTVIQRSENNPLKFALGTDEALKKILSAPDPAFLTGTAAFEDAFDDIRCHQMAMLAGVRAGFDALLKHFNPDRFEREADGGGRHGFGGKGRYWERYRSHYQTLADDPDGAFRRLFGDEFARAYEEQLARLKSARRAQRPRQA